ENKDIQLPRGVPNRAYGNALLAELRGLEKQRRPDIVDFTDSVFYEIKTSRTAIRQRKEVEDQLLSLYRLTESLTIKYGGANWNKDLAKWYPDHTLRFPGDPRKCVCTQATDYQRWHPGIILYSVLKQNPSKEEEEEVQLAIVELAPELNSLKPQLEK